MPIHVDISHINRIVFIVARGEVGRDEIRRTIGALAGSRLISFGKIVDISGLSSSLPHGQLKRIAAALRRDSDRQGPVAFLIDPHRADFAQAVANILKCDHLIKLFHSLHEARRWAQP